MLGLLSIGVWTYLVVTASAAFTVEAFGRTNPADTAMWDSMFLLVGMCLLIALMIWRWSVMFLWQFFTRSSDVLVADAVLPREDRSSQTKVRATVIRVYFSGDRVAIWSGVDTEAAKAFLAKVERAANYTIDDAPLELTSHGATYRIPGRNISHWTESQEDAWVTSGSAFSVDLTRAGPDERRGRSRPT